MTNEQKKQERKELRLEIRARREVMRRIAYPLNQLQIAAEKEKQHRKDREEALKEYKTINEVMDAYGYDQITDDERRSLIEAIESGERYIEDTITPVGLALKILRQFHRSMQTEADALEFELLPPEEQTRRLEASEKRRIELEERRAARMRID